MPTEDNLNDYLGLLPEVVVSDEGPPKPEQPKVHVPQTPLNNLLAMPNLWAAGGPMDLWSTHNQSNAVTLQLNIALANLNTTLLDELPVKQLQMVQQMADRMAEARQKLTQGVNPEHEKQFHKHVVMELEKLYVYLLQQGISDYETIKTQLQLLLKDINTKYKLEKPLWWKYGQSENYESRNTGMQEQVANTAVLKFTPNKGGRYSYVHIAQEFIDRNALNELPSKFAVKKNIKIVPGAETPIPLRNSVERRFGVLRFNNGFIKISIDTGHLLGDSVKVIRRDAGQPDTVLFDNNGSTSIEPVYIPLKDVAGSSFFIKITPSDPFNSSVLVDVEYMPVFATLHVNQK